MAVEMAKTDSTRDDLISILASLRFTHRWVSSTPAEETILESIARLEWILDQDEAAMNDPRRIAG